jgi:hypothetical protein
MAEAPLWRPGRTPLIIIKPRIAAKDTTVMRAYIPALKGEVLRPHG